MADAIALGAAAAAPAPDEKPSYREVLRDRNIAILATSRAAGKLALATVSYGSMVYLARQDASQFAISLVSAATYVAPLFFGLQGGTLSDSLSKRIALIGGFVAQAATVFLIPILFGTGVFDLVLIMFLSSALMQVVTPSLKSAVAIVASPAQLATTSAFVGVVGSIASAFGSAFLAPILIKQGGINAVLFVSGLIYLLGAIRSFRLPDEEQAGTLSQALKKVEWKPKALSMRATAQWILDHRAVATMILTGAIVVALFEATNTLLPVYVRDVLDADPANSIYIFAPAAIGFLIGTFAAPQLMHKYGERRLVIIALVASSVSMMLLGFINQVDGFFAIFSPLRLLSLFGIDLSDQVLAAGVISIPGNFGSCAAAAAVQTFINRRVPLVQQGATFGLEEVQENALTLAAVLALGAISNFTGPKIVFIIAPPVVIGFVIWLLRYSYRMGDLEEPTRREAIDALMDSSEDATVPDPTMEGTPSVGESSVTG
jgi:MFS family permease